MGTRFYYKKSNTGTDPIIERLSARFERSLVINDDGSSSNLFIETPPDSSECEVVSPKPGSATKKSGRRLRPFRDICLTDSDQTDEDLKRSAVTPARRNLQSKITETPPQSKGKKGKRKDSLVEAISPHQLRTFSASSIIDLWEMACIVNSRGLLHALGFKDEQVNISKLTKVLEEELRGLEHDPQTNILRALVALQSTELEMLRGGFCQQYENNDKLKEELKLLNQKVDVLSVEMDEQKTELEENCKQQMHELQQKHAKDLQNHRQNVGRLEEQVNALEQEEIKLKTEVELVRNENKELEAEQQKLQLQITELLEENIKLNNDLAACDAMRPEALTDESKCTESDELLQLLEELAGLQTENAQLREKNDELNGELENEKFLFEEQRVILEQERVENYDKLAIMSEQLRRYKRSNKNVRLSPIAENALLEEQYVLCEAEFAEQKRLLQRTGQRVTAQREEIKSLRMSFGVLLEMIIVACQIPQEEREELKALTGVNDYTECPAELLGQLIDKTAEFLVDGGYLNPDAEGTEYTLQDWLVSVLGSL